ncbi:hypothetical protein HMN09_00345500 [Mycena chlorophos]|uniref:Uncharacterized protein n=1 Tax=Mycena chlorophos TaxID=658473 RepID=A0A8H6TKH3_MYCCL|nr:hypothetical protein HMN09_00345500 [Mycena chlorophos]
MTANAQTHDASSRLPAEIWLDIQALAIEEYSPLALAPQDMMDWEMYQPLFDPFMSIGEFWRNAKAFSLVNKRWNALGDVLLYSCISVGADERHFEQLLQVLQHSPDLATCVRAIRISRTRFDWNRKILELCSSSVQVILLPEMLEYDEETGLLQRRWDRSGVELAFPALQYVYWTKAETAVGLLEVLLDPRAAPNVEGLYLSNSRWTTLPMDDHIDFPTFVLPKLRRLGLGNTDTVTDASFSNLDFFRGITTLVCSPEWMSVVKGVLPALRVLRLVGTRCRIDLVAFLGKCPVVQEISLELFNVFVAAAATVSNNTHTDIHLIRAHANNAVLTRNWNNFWQFFRLIATSGHWCRHSSGAPPCIMWGMGPCFHAYDVCTDAGDD